MQNKQLWHTLNVQIMYMLKVIGDDMKLLILFYILLIKVSGYSLIVISKLTALLIFQFFICYVISGALLVYHELKIFR